MSCFRDICVEVKVRHPITCRWWVAPSYAVNSCIRGPRVALAAGGMGPWVILDSYWVILLFGILQIHETRHAFPISNVYLLNSG